MLKLNLFRSPKHSITALVACLTLLAGMAGPVSTAHAEDHIVQAGPNVFGRWYQVGAHAGAVTYTITATPIGGSSIDGEVLYFGADGRQHQDRLVRYTVIRTCDCVGTVKVRFRGIPLGTAVKVTIN